MAQPPTVPILAHEDVRLITGLTQRTFQSAAAGAASTFVWEYDLAARLTDFNQFLTQLVAPANSSCIAIGGAGPQVTPQPAIGPFADAFAFTGGAGGGTLQLEYAADASPCNYRAMSNTVVVAGIATNISGLRVTARFVRFTFTNITAGAPIEVGFYIRNI